MTLDPEKVEEITDKAIGYLPIHRSISSSPGIACTI